ncbi:MAG: hypothetical protein ABI780_04055 [Ardenticatenales bacterium]
MRMHEGLAAAAVAGATLWAFGAAAQAERPGNTVDMAGLSRSLASAPAVAAVPLAMDGPRPAAVRQQGVVPVTSEDFEGDFPPDGWTTYDSRTRQGQTENYTWGNQDIVVAPPRQGFPDGGGLKAPWAIGGGRLGASLTPGSTYDQPLSSVLQFGPFDASDFDGGVQVNFLTYLDGPVDAARGALASFGVCVTTTPDPLNGSCKGIIVSQSDGTDLRKTWLSLREPMAFPLAARPPAVYVSFIAQDLTAAGTFTGSLIDNVTIEGLSSSVPTSTVDPERTPQASSTPRPTSPPQPTLPAATPDGRTAYLPMSVQGVDKDTMAPAWPTSLPGLIDVGFGTDVLQDGTLIGRASRFGEIDRLCSAQHWTQLPIGTALRVQWYQLEGKVWKETVLDQDNEQLNPSLVTTSTDGGHRQCIRYSDASGDPVPVDPGMYRVAVYLRGEAIAWADEVAEVTGGGVAPTPGGPTPIPSATPVLPDNCQNPVVNGDFEQLGDGWRPAIKDGHSFLVTPGFQSLYAAAIGGYDDAEDDIVNAGRIDLLPLDDIESVIVQFSIGIVGDETRGNGDNADRFYIGVLGDDSDHIRTQYLSEDSEVGGALIPIQNWFPLQATVTENWAKEDGFATASLFFAARTNATHPTAFLVDNVAVKYCRKPGVAASRPVRRPASRITASDVDAAVRDARPFATGALRPAGAAAPLSARPLPRIAETR